MKRLYVHQRSDGCIESFLDFAKSRAALETSGWILTRQPDDADLVLINTCIVGEIVQQHCIEDIQELKSKMQNACDLVVTGCLPDYDKEALDKLGVDFAFSPRKMELFLERYNLQVPEEVAELEPEYLGPYNLFNWVSRLLDTANRLKIPLPRHFYRRFALIEDRDMHYLRISRGCVEGCTFCATKFATGRLKSVLPEIVLHRFDQALAQGKRNFALCAEDTGAYGHDIGTDLPSLMAKMLERPANFILSIRQHQPNWVINNLEAYEAVLSDPRVKSFTVPFQSGDDRVLKLMGRRYRASEVEGMVQTIHRAAPHVMLRTHAIAGFPTETRDEFKKTYRMVGDLPWDMVLVFPYTDRPRTRAASIEPKVPLAELERRTWLLNFLVLKTVYLNNFNPLPLVFRNPMAAPRLFHD